MDVLADLERRLILKPFATIKFKNKFIAVQAANCQRRCLYYELWQAAFESVEVVKLKYACSNHL